MKMKTSNTFEPRVLDSVKEKSEADIIKLTKLNVAWDCCYSIGEFELCDIISKKIGKINGVEV
jgi:hypothetical protein